MMLVEPIYIYMLVAFTGLSILLSLATFPLRPALGFWWAVMTIPLAAELFNIGTFTLVLPTDAFGLALGMITFFYTIFLQPGILQQLWQKVTLFRWIALYFLWMGIATLFSSDMLVSMKFWIAQGAYFIAFGLGAVVWLYNRKPSYTPLSLYKNALFWTAAIVLMFCIKNHISFGLSKINVWVTRPFLRDHTAYGAYASWFFIASLVFLLYSTSPVYLLLSILTGAGLILSYSRGGWLSALGALGVLGALELLRRLSPILRLSFLGVGGVGILVAVLTLFEYNPQILEIYAYQKGGEIGKHLTSSFDIKQNVSNLERVNRWYAALQMLIERPIFGFGPNTFAQEYSAYQSSLTRTKISVEMGEVGGAHSEYLTAASEMGVPGLIFLIGIYLSSVITGLRGFLKANSREQKAQYALLTFPLLTYYLHGFINNFMDHGHMAALVYLHWGLLMLLRLQEENLPSFHVSEKHLVPQP